MALSAPLSQDRLKCYRHDVFGIMAVDRVTWKQALQTEADLWAGSRDTEDRANDHIRGFDSYGALPRDADLGHVAEFGSGPFTQLKTSVVAARPDLRMKSITLSDPNVHQYIARVSQCTYKQGWLLSPDIPTYFVSAGAEVPLFDEVRARCTALWCGAHRFEARRAPPRGAAGTTSLCGAHRFVLTAQAFDTVIMINVLEHTLNGYDVLENLYRALKPGGYLIFHDRAWPAFNHDATIERDNMLHPIRPYAAALAAFTAAFEPLLNKVEQQEMDMRQWGGTAVAPITTFNFIGRKPVTGPLAAVTGDVANIGPHSARLQLH